MATRLIPKPGNSQEELVEWLEAILRLTGWSSSKLASEAGLAASTVNRFLAGAGHLLSTSSVGRIEMAAERRLRERVNAGEISIPKDMVKPDGSPADRMIRIPEVDPRRGEVEMGVGDEWGFPENWFRFHYGADPSHCCVVPVEDDAMFAELRIGDRVVVDTSRKEPSPAGIFLIDDGVAWTARHLEVLPGVEPPTVMITSRNHDYRSREARIEALKIVGRVIGMWRRL